MKTSYKYKLLTKAIRTIIQELNEHPVNYPHTHVHTTCYACENTIITSHTTDWVLNPAAGNVNYCSEPVDTDTPIQTVWWADDEQWIIDNICAYQTTASDPSNDSCTELQTPFNTNFQQNAQAYGWETAFKCLIDSTNNPCASLRSKIAKLQDKLPNVGPNQQVKIENKINIAQNLYENAYNCGLSPDQGTTLTGGGGMNFDPNSWKLGFYDMVNNSGNPCNVLENKINTWQQKLDNITGWSVSYREMLEIKIEYAQELQSADEFNCNSADNV